MGLKFNFVIHLISAQILFRHIHESQWEELIVLSQRPELFIHESKWSCFWDVIATFTHIQVIALMVQLAKKTSCKHLK